MTLHQRLEDATEGTRELDRELYLALRPFANVYEHKAAFADDPAGYWFWISQSDYTTSLDAALALAERLWPHVMWRIGHDPIDGSIKADIVIAQRPGDPPPVTAYADTAPLAMCAAILRAKAKATPDTGEGG